MPVTTVIEYFYGTANLFMGLALQSFYSTIVSRLYFALEINAPLRGQQHEKLLTVGLLLHFSTN